MKRLTRTKRHQIQKCTIRAYLKSKKGSKLLIAFRALQNGKINFQAKNAMITVNADQDTALIALA